MMAVQIFILYLLDGVIYSNLFVGITSKKRKFIIHPEFFDANNIISNTSIQNLKSKPNMVHDLSRQIRISLKKQILENSVKHKIHQIVRITSKNDKTEYRGRKYAKNEVVLVIHLSCVGHNSTS